MELNNDFEVKAPVGTTWAVLTDVEKIAPCLPGAQLQEIDGDEFKGQVKVKVGPITANYKGAAEFVKRDDDNHTAVLKAEGRDARNGNASAMITASAVAVDDATTRVTVETELTVTGKVAQFGRGVMADVSANLMGQFAENLEELMEGDQQADEAPDEEPAVSDPVPVADGPRRIDSPEPEAVDLLQTAGAPVAKRVIPAVIGVLLLIFILRRLLGDD